MTDLVLLEQKALVDSFLEQGPRPLSSFSFVSLFAWCDFFTFEFKMIDDCLCIFAKGDSGVFLYLPPLGKELSPSTQERVFAYMAQNGKNKAVHRIENIPGNLLSAFDTGRYNQYIKPSEYLYRKEDLAALKGNAYKSQRHDCNLFVAHQSGVSFEPYQEGDLDGCMAVYDRWRANRRQASTDEIFRCMLDENRQVHARLLKFYKPLGLVARVLKVEGRIIGYTFGFSIDENTFCVYAEITDLTRPGAAAFIFKSFCKDVALEPFSRINTMDDFAIPKVAQAKQAYHPIELIPSYSISLKKVAVL